MQKCRFSGKVYKPHFAHKSDFQGSNPCTYSDETEEHKEELNELIIEYQLNFWNRMVLNDADNRILFLDVDNEDKDKFVQAYLKQKQIENEKKNN